MGMPKISIIYLLNSIPEDEGVSDLYQVYLRLFCVDIIFYLLK